MGTNIEWATEVWNPTTGCTRVSAGCDNCYAVRMTHRLQAMGKAGYAGLTVLNGHGGRHFNGVVRCHEDRLDRPLRWRKPRRIFVNSMSDLFHKDVSFDFIDKVFAVMALCPQHVFMVLTKRPERMTKYVNGMWRAKDIDDEKVAIMASMPDKGRNVDAYVGEEGSGYFDHGYLSNLWLGTSVEDQKTADERIPHLLKCPAAVRFLSCEPLLWPIDLRTIPNTSPPHPECPCGAPSRRIDWAIIGGESGPGARPCNVEWIRDIKQQCIDARVRLFIKQAGSNFVCDVGPDDATRDDLLHEGCEVTPQGRIILRDHKGGDEAEWPADLRGWRQMPKCAASLVKSAALTADR